MAIQDQGQGQLQELLGVVKRRALQILLPVAFMLVVGYCIARLMPRKYLTQTGIELRETTLPIGGEGYDAKSLQRDISSTVWQVKQVERVRRVVERLEWPDYTALTPQEQHDYVREMIDNVNIKLTLAKNNQGSSLILIDYTDSDPQRAEQFLNRLRETYTAEVLDRMRTDAREALDVLHNQKTDALNVLDAREKEATELKKLHNVSVTQQAPGGGRQRDEDPVFTRLAKAEQQQSDITIQIAADEAALATLEEQLEQTPREIAESELQGGISFDKELEDIAAEKATLREEQKGLRPAHSRYNDAELKIAKLEEKEELLRESVSRPELQQNKVRNPRRDEITREIEQKKVAISQAQGLQKQLARTIESLTASHAERAEIFSEIQHLDSETAIAERNYNASSDAFNRQKRLVDLLMEGTSNPFEITELARTPKQPTWPNPPLIIAGAGLLGFAIGLLSALAAEYGRSAFRGVSDVSRSLSAPILGVINEIVTEREIARARIRRVLSVTSTLALMGAFLWVTWAFENHPRWLGSGLTQAIEGVREMFR